MKDCSALAEVRGLWVPSSFWRVDLCELEGAFSSDNDYRFNKQTYGDRPLF